MSTPLATIADALIEFILSLLRDPAAAAAFSADPERVLASKGLSNVCVDDVRSVLPVVVDHPAVSPRPSAPSVTPPTTHPVTPPVGPPVGPHPELPPVIKEITNVANNFTIDNRTTIVDQSVNQNIWAQGDVTQYFDQKAVMAVGDGSIAAGNNLLVDNSQTNVTTGDISIGNTQTTTEISGSFNDSSTNVAVTATAQDSFNDSSTHLAASADIDNSFTTQTDVSTTIVDTSPVTVDALAGADTSTAYIAPHEVDYPAPPLELDEH